MWLYTVSCLYNVDQFFVILSCLYNIYIYIELDVSMVMINDYSEPNQTFVFWMKQTSWNRLQAWSLLGSSWTFGEARWLFGASRWQWWVAKCASWKYSERWHFERWQFENSSRPSRQGLKSKMRQRQICSDLMKILQLKRSQKHEVDFVPELGNGPALYKEHSGPSWPLTMTSPMVRFSNMRMKWCENSAMWISLLTVSHWHLSVSFSKNRNVTNNIWLVQPFLFKVVQSKNGGLWQTNQLNGLTPRKGKVK